METKYDSRLPEFLTRYLIAVEHGYAPQKLHLVCALAATATAVGRRVWLADRKPLYLNDYYLILGVPGCGKSQAIKQMMEFLKLAGYRNFAPTRASLPRLYKKMEEFQRVPFGSDTKQNFSIENAALNYDSEMLIAAHELAVFLGHGESTRDFVTALNNLYDNDDEFEYETVSSVSARVERPTINVVAATTPSDFHDIFGHGATAGGLMPRFYVASVFADTLKRFDAPPMMAEHSAWIVNWLARLFKLRAELGLSSRAYDLLRQLHDIANTTHDGALQDFYARRGMRRKKMAATFAAMRAASEVTEYDVLIAHTLLCYAEIQLPSVLGQYGAARNSIVAEKIMQALRSANKPMKTRELMRIVDVDVNDSRGLLQTIEKLTSAGKIQQVEGGGFLAVAAQSSYRMDSFVDWKLLQGILPASEIEMLESSAPGDVKLRD